MILINYSDVRICFFFRWLSAEAGSSEALPTTPLFTLPIDTTSIDHQNDIHCRALLTHDPELRDVNISSSGTKGNTPRRIISRVGSSSTPYTERLRNT